MGNIDLFTQSREDREKFHQIFKCKNFVNLALWRDKYEKI